MMLSNHDFYTNSRFCLLLISFLKAYNHFTFNGDFHVKNAFHTIPKDMVGIYENLAKDLLAGNQMNKNVPILDPNYINYNNNVMSNNYINGLTMQPTFPFQATHFSQEQIPLQQQPPLPLPPQQQQNHQIPITSHRQDIPTNHLQQQQVPPPPPQQSNIIPQIQQMKNAPQTQRDSISEYLSATFTDIDMFQDMFQMTSDGSFNEYQF